MYFVLTKRAPYVLFCLTPSERAAVGLTADQVVHLLVRTTPAADWSTLAQWPASDFSHTDFMAAWHRAEEPADPRQLMEALPEPLRGSART